MVHNCAVHLGVESENSADVKALLTKISTATRKQPGVTFAYTTCAPEAVPDRRNKVPREKK